MKAYLLALPLLVLNLSTAPVRAALLFEEDFNYAVGTQLHGKNGGEGFGTAWEVGAPQGSATISSKSLSYTFADGSKIMSDQSLLLSGAPTASNNYSNRRLDVAHNVTEFYVSFLVESPVWSTSGTVGFSIGLSAASLSNQLISSSYSASPTPSNRWITSVGGGAYGVYNGVATNQTHFLVARFSKTEGSTAFNQVDLWVNPTSTLQGTPDVTSYKGGGTFGSFYYIGFQNRGSEGSSYYYGALRGGNTWDDVVTPVPEPSTMALLLVGLGVGAYVARRRKICEA